jgi:2-polyprenyl-6-hydroxyphenyl methylase/3-demethylubiquinone-9 3-methyltransferase
MRIFHYSNGSSVSQEETAKFARMADEWWNPKKNPLISMNPTRISFITQKLVSKDKLNGSMGIFEPLRGLRMLDVGCGGGLLSESLARLGAEITAIDPSLRIVQAAQEHSNRGGATTQSIKYIGGKSIEEMAQEYHNKENDSKFDAICILEVIEHASDPVLLVQSAASILRKPDGVLFISTINRTWKSYAMAIIGGEYITRMLPIGTHSWEKFKTPNEVQSTANSCGLEQIAINGMVLEPRIFDLSWRLDERDLDVNWISAYKHKTHS